MLSEPYSSVRVRLADGRELSGADGLQVWMARRYEREHQEPNLCGVAVPGYLDENGDFEWRYPVAECPTAGAPGPAKLRWADVDRDLLQRPLTPECSTCPRWSPARGCLCHSETCLSRTECREGRAARQREED